MKSLITALALGLAASGAASAASVVNGGFEQPGTFSGSFATLGAGDSYPTGWSIESGSIDLINQYWQPSEGNYSLDMTGYSPATISQTLTGLQSHAKYHLTFDMAANTDGGATVKQLSASVGGTSGLFTFDKSGHDHANMGWQSMVLDFTATSSSMLLTFQSLDQGYWGAALDNVAIAPAAVPVPAAGFLLLGGLGALAAARRRRG